MADAKLEKNTQLNSQTTKQIRLKIDIAWLDGMA